jgi:glyoxylase-like metal-dependent hydrolase (beta-lactamase superfamily II)
VTVAFRMNVTILDTNWAGRPHSIAAALLESNTHRAVVDPGPGSTISTLRERLESRGLSVRELHAILLTHIHLDHAGATGSLVRENPRLKVYVHQQGAPHLVDPAKLLASAARLWPDTLQQLFGETLPVPAANLHIVDGGETIPLGARKLDVVYTPGHASHHVSYFDDAEGLAFVGDTTGIRIHNGPYVLPATPPPDIDLGLWETSLGAILARRPARLFLTHFGYSENPPAHIADFRERLRRWAEVAAECLHNATPLARTRGLSQASAADRAGPSPKPHDSVALECFITKCRAEMEAHLGVAEAEHHAFTAGLDLSFLGLARYLRKHEQRAAEAKS